jgi:hypothetical protein
VGYQYLRPAYYQSTGAANSLKVWKTEVKLFVFNGIQISVRVNSPYFGSEFRAKGHVPMNYLYGVNKAGGASTLASEGVEQSPLVRAHPLK